MDVPLVRLVCRFLPETNAHAFFQCEFAKHCCLLGGFGFCVIAAPLVEWLDRLLQTTNAALISNSFMLV